MWHSYNGKFETSFICYTTQPVTDDDGLNKYYFDISEIDRSDSTLIQVVKELKEEAGGTFAELHTIEIPNDVNWEIEEYDGVEWIAEVHRTWGWGNKMRKNIRG